MKMIFENKIKFKTIEDKFKIIMSILEKEVKHYKTPVVDLIKFQTKDELKVLITTILSSRTKDEVTLKASSNLFNKAKDIYEMNKLSVSEIEKLIYPVGFYKTKARNLKKLFEILINDYYGKVPNSFDELIKLPGVGRKTANLVLSVAFNKPYICVDTHVHRISNRLGLVSSKDVFETEQQLMKYSKEYWTKINKILVSFGQNICKPVKPKCNECSIKHLCNYYKKNYNKK